jgi:hypothetical protein
MKINIDSQQPKAVQWFGTGYARENNLKNNTGGHLFQGVGRFASKACIYLKYIFYQKFILTKLFNRASILFEVLKRFSFFRPISIVMPLSTFRTPG